MSLLKNDIENYKKSMKNQKHIFYNHWSFKFIKILYIPVICDAINKKNSDLCILNFKFS